MRDETIYDDPVSGPQTPEQLQAIEEWLREVVRPCTPRTTTLPNGDTLTIIESPEPRRQPSNGTAHE